MVLLDYLSWPEPVDRTTRLIPSSGIPSTEFRLAQFEHHRCRRPGGGNIAAHEAVHTLVCGTPTTRTTSPV